MSRHAAPNTTKSITSDLHDGFMEGFGYWDRNGRHRAEYVETATDQEAAA